MRDTVGADMEKDVSNQSGVIEGASRVLRELLKSSRFKKTITIILNELDPENAPLLIRVMKEEDPDLFLSLLSFSPALANLQIEMMTELLRQFVSFPPGLYTGFLSQLLQDINAKRAGEAAALLRILALRAINDSEGTHADSLDSCKNEFIDGYKQCLRNFPDDRELDLDQVRKWFFDWANEAASKMGKEAAKRNSKTSENIRNFVDSNPEFLNHVLRPLLDAASGKKNDQKPGRQGRSDE